MVLPAFKLICQRVCIGYSYIYTRKYETKDALDFLSTPRRAAPHRAAARGNPFRFLN